MQCRRAGADKTFEPRNDKEFSVLLKHAVDDAAAGNQFIERHFQLSPVLAATDAVLNGRDRLAKL
jgi:hypothetical protein